MKNKITNHGRRVLLLIVIPLLIIVGVMLGMFRVRTSRYIDDATKNQIIEMLEKTSKPFSDNIEHAVLELNLIDNMMGTMYPSHSCSMNDLRKYLDLFRKSEHADRILLMDGSCRFTSLEGETGTLDIVRERSSFFDKMQPLIRHLDWNGQSRYIVAIPTAEFRVDGVPFCAVMFLFRPEVLNGIFSPNSYAGKARYYVMDNTGLVIFTSDPAFEDNGNRLDAYRNLGIIDQEEADAIRQGFVSGKNECIDVEIDGTDSFFGYYTPSKDGYNYAVEVPTDIARNALTSLRDDVLWGTVIIAIIMFIIFSLLFITVISSVHNKSIAEKEKKVSQAKSVFLSNMSHDIRTPMNAIVGYTDLALAHKEDRERVNDFLEKIRSSSAHLLSLINDVLDMSRIEYGKVSISREPQVLSSIIDDVDSIIRTEAERHGHTFTVDSANIRHDFIQCDKLRLKQILINLLSNSVKYTPENGNIALRVRETDSGSENTARFEIKVKDNGIGMSKEFLATIFEPFSRAKNSTKSGIQGTGLGMSITKSLIDMMGGTITIASEPDRGTETTVILEFDIDKKAGTATVTRTATFDFTGKKILLVEDNELNREIATAILQDSGFTVTTAEDGSLALDMVRHGHTGDFDAILMDIQMPIMNGYEATKYIRALGTPLSRIPIIAMTANAFEEDRKAAFDTGMNEHIAKPIDIAKLKETLSRFL